MSTLENTESRRFNSDEIYVNVYKRVYPSSAPSQTENLKLGSQASALKAINRMLTMRNWLIGYYIVEFEQKGKERAQYGDKLLKRLEERVDSKGLTEQTFRFCRVFYSYYPQMGALFQTSSPIENQIGATVSRELQLPDNQAIEKYATVSREFISNPVDVISRLSFSHIRELLTIDDPLVRYFYEQFKHESNLCSAIR